MTTTVRFLQSLATTTRSYKRGDEVAGWDDTDAAALVGAGYAEKVIAPQIALNPASVNASGNGSGVDFRYAGNSFQAVQQVGAVTGTDPTITGKIQESDDNSTWTDISGAAFTAVTASNAVERISFTKAKRYLRHAYTVGGTSSPTFIIGASFIPISSAL